MSELYNLKIIQYANGQVEIRKYSDIVGGNTRKSEEWGIDYSSVFRGKTQRMKERREEREKKYNPFTDEREKEISFERAIKNENDSFKRTKQKVYDYSRQGLWEYFITITFDAKKVDRTDFDACMNKARTWVKNVKKRYCPSLKYLLVPELHADKKSWHIHGLLMNCDELPLSDSGKKDKKGRVIYNLNFQGGFNSAIRIGTSKKDIYSIAGYVSKYITKDMCRLTSGKHRYYVSKDIDKPIETFFLCSDINEINDIIERVTNSLGVELVYEKVSKGEYLEVDYKYYSEVEENGTD